MLELFDTCRSFLKIKKPVEFTLKPRIYRNCTGVHWAEVKDGKVLKHIIRISYSRLAEDLRQFNTVLAHEFVHAWQAEYRPIRKKAHNKSFVKKALELEKYLIAMEFDVKDLYIPNIDTE